MARAIAIAAPCQRALPTAPVAERAVIDRRSRGAILVDVGLELLGAVNPAVARLQRPSIRWIDREPERMGVELRRFDVPAILIRLSPSKRRRFHLDPIDDRPGG